MTAIAPATSTNARAVAGADTLRGATLLFLRFSTPRLLAANVVVLVIARLYAGDFRAWDAVVVAAVALYWPIQEWVLHAYVLHMRPRVVRGVTVDPTFAKYHRYHHAHPWVLERTFLPVRVLAPLIPLNVLVFWLVMPTWGLALTAMAAMATAALVYEWTHYLTHTPYRPRSRYYRAIQRNHMRHHFQDDRSYFAFTAPWMDGWMGTAGGE